MTAVKFLRLPLRGLGPRYGEAIFFGLPLPPSRRRVHTFTFALRRDKSA